MRVRFSFSNAVRLLLALTFVVGSAVLLSSSDKPAFTAMDKAFYADANAINFVRPGLALKVQSASIADDGTIKAQIKLTDPKGLPLDREGITTPGAISTRFVVGFIPNGQKQYISYITRQVEQHDHQSHCHAGDIRLRRHVHEGCRRPVHLHVQGKAPASFDKDSTHSIGV